MMTKLKMVEFNPNAPIPYSDKTSDWIIHIVPPTSPYLPDDIPEYILNSHTHGMYEYFHREFQVLLALDASEICRLLETLCRRVEAGEAFSPGDMVTGLYECAVRLDAAIENGENVLRLIIPDSNNRFPEDPLCEAPYKYQTGTYYDEY